MILMILVILMILLIFMITMIRITIAKAKLATHILKQSLDNNAKHDNYQMDN